MPFLQGPKRPSNLPKFAAGCVWYRSKDNPGEAAERGTNVDAVYRDELCRDWIYTVDRKIDDHDVRAAKWAADKTEEIADGRPILARRPDCQVVIPGFPMPGEVDALCSSLFTSFDLKTGQWYEYELQFAAYAWGLMEKYFAPVWTVWALFCDLQQFFRYRFTYEEAKAKVSAISAAHDAGGPPKFNFYCGWCENAPICPVLINRADHALSLVEDPTFSFQKVLDDPNRVGAFLSSCHALKPLQQPAEAKAKEYIRSGRAVPEWSLITRPLNKYVEPLDLLPLVDRLGPLPVLLRQGNVSAQTYEDLCRVAGIQPDLSVEKPGGSTTYLRHTNNKKE